MRKVPFGSPPFPIATASRQVQWLVGQVRNLCDASHDQITGEIADTYEITNLTVRRTLDCDAATLPELCEFIGTFIADLKNRGSKRG